MSETDSIQKALKEERIAQWDFYTEKVEEFEVQLRNFDVEVVRGPIANSGYAVRVISPKDKKVGIGIGVGKSLQPAEIKNCIQTASIGARISEYPNYALPTPKKYPHVKTADPKIVSNAEGLVKDRAEELVSLLKQSNNVLPTFGKIRTYHVSTTISNSEGIQAEKQETYFYIELALKAERKSKLAEYWPMAFVRRAEDVQLEKEIPKWTKLAEETLKAKVPQTVKTTVIFAPRVSGEILQDTVGFSCLAPSVFRGISRFKKDQKVGSGELTIYDDGIRDYALGSSPFDDEGTPQSMTTLIENGVHKNFLYDAMYAATLNVNSTGNGQKLPASSFAFAMIDAKYVQLPSAQPTNITVKPGDMSLDEMIATTKDGIYVEQFSSLSSDPFTTSFGSEIRNAYMIEKGELTTPLKGGQISGFVLDSQNSQGKKTLGLLSQVSGITNKAEMTGRCIMPYMRFEGVQVVGK